MDTATAEESFMALTIIGLAVLFFLGHALNWFFIKTKIPDLLLLVGLGYVLGPVMGVLQPEDFGKVGAILSTTALIVILYEGGLHLKANDLVKSSLPAAGLSVLGFVLIVGSAALTAYTIGFQSWPVALLLGLGVGSTSSAIVIPMVKPLSIKDDSKTILSLESAFTDVLAIVIFLVIVDAVASGVFSMQKLLMGIGPNTLLSGVIGLVSGSVWALIKKRFAPILTMAFAGEAWALLTYGLIEFAQYNGAIGVLALGFSLANLDRLPRFMKSQLSSVPVSYSDLSLLGEITFLLRTFFFIYLGILIRFSNTRIVLLAMLISVLIFVTRYIAIRLLMRPKKYSRLDAMVSVAMGPRGLACAVLATIPLQRGIAGGQWLQDIIFAIIPMSILLTAVLVSLSETAGFRRVAGNLFSVYPEETEKVKEPTTPSV